MTRIACAQIAPAVGRLAENLDMCAAAIADAVAAGADPVVLPELATSGYMFADADEARSVALRPPDTAFGTWTAAAGGPSSWAGSANSATTGCCPTARWCWTATA